MQFVTSARIFAVRVSLPPEDCTPKPNRTAKTIRGRIALRLSSSKKSGLVKKFTSISAKPRPATSTLSSTTLFVVMGKIRRTMYMKTAAMAAVTRKVPTVTPMSLPARFAPEALAIAEDIEKNTRGTTIQNMRLMNTVPRGSSLVPSSGASAPIRQPQTMPNSIKIIKPYDLKNDFFSMIYDLPDYLLYLNYIPIKLQCKLIFVLETL